VQDGDVQVIAHQPDSGLFDQCRGKAQHSSGADGNRGARVYEMDLYKFVERFDAIKSARYSGD
jgi:hypothetical protein